MLPFFCFKIAFPLNFLSQNSQTWANDHLRIVDNIWMSQYELLYQKGNSEQRQPVNNGHFVGVPRVVVVHRCDFVIS